MPTLTLATISKQSDYYPKAVAPEDKAVSSFKENSMNPGNGLPSGNKVIGKRSLYKLKVDELFKLRLVAQASNQRAGINFGRSLAAVACIGTERQVLIISAEYG